LTHHLHLIKCSYLPTAVSLGGGLHERGRRRHLEDREHILRSSTDKLYLAITSYTSEVERERAQQRTHDALLRKARARHVTGGRVYGYDNVEVSAPGPDGRPPALRPFDTPGPRFRP
jgi:hypothetical protein